MLGEFLSGLTMNGPAMVLFLAQAKKAQERKLICERKRDARRSFQEYVRICRFTAVSFVAYSQLFSPLSRTKNMGETIKIFILNDTKCC